MPHGAVVSGISRVERAALLLADAEAARALLEASTALRCGACNAVLLKYDPPLGRLTFPCRRCKAWIDTATDRRSR